MDIKINIENFHVEATKMGQVLACCTVNEREANDDAKYCPSSQEIEQPWKERIETNDAKVVLALDPNFTQEEIAQERMKIISSIFEERRVRPCVLIYYALSCQF